MTRKNLAGGFTQTDRADGKDEERRIEYEADEENDPAGNQANLRTQNEFIKVLCRGWVEINLQVPAQCEQRE